MLVLYYYKNIIHSITIIIMQLNDIMNKKKIVIKPKINNNNNDVKVGIYILYIYI